MIMELIRRCRLLATDIGVVSLGFVARDSKNGQSL